MKKKHERKPRTHFEQIPLEVVKSIAEADVSKDEKSDALVEPVSGKREPSRVPARSHDRKRR
jgi:hypothetical protein